MTSQDVPSHPGGTHPPARPGTRRATPEGGPPRRAPTGAGTVSLVAVVALVALSPVLRRYDLGGSAAYLVVGLVLGLPHGAVDHLVPAWLSVRARPAALRLAVPLGYAAVAGVALVTFRTAPGPALLVFLVLSIVHFGTADQAYHAERDGRPVRYTIAGVLARGSPPVVVPLLCWPDAVDPLLAAVAPGVPDLLDHQVRLVAAAGLLAAVVTAALRDLSAARPFDAAEPLLLVTLFAAVPPALAVGGYFAAWHSARHVTRLLHSDPGNRADLAAGRVGPPLRRLARQAVLPSLGATAALVALAGWPGRPAEPLAATVAVLAALTVPHSVLVAWMDRRARTGRPTPPSTVGPEPAIQPPAPPVR